MPFHDVAEAAGHAGELALERSVLERLDLAAVAADEVMVVVAPGLRGLVASGAVVAPTPTTLYNDRPLG